MNSNLILTETDHGHYSVRPHYWSGIWNQKGQIKESLNHTAVFAEKEDAKWFIQMKDAEEQGLIKILPVAIGCDVYFIPSKTNYKLNVLNGYEQNNRVYHQRVANIVFNKRGWYLECDKNLEYGVDHILVDKLYKETWFTSKEEAEQALADMKGV